MTSISKQAYRKYEQGIGLPREDVLNRLSEILKVKKEYLTNTEILPIYQKLSSSGQEDTVAFAIDKLSEEQEQSKIIDFNKSLLPYLVIDQALSAATGFGYTDDVSYSTVYWHKELEYDLATWISGNSMEPDFHNGEVALIKKQDQVDYEGQVCAVDWDGNSYIKKIFIEEDGLVLRSINPIYDDKFANWDEQPRIIGIVTAHFKPEQKK